MEIKRHIFQEATTLSPVPGTAIYLFDTALGLSLFPTRNGAVKYDYFAAPSTLQHMVQQNLLDENIVSLKFCRTDLEAGEMILGGLPPNLRREEMIEVPLNHSKIDDSDHFWRYYTQNGWQVSVQNMSMTSNNFEAYFPVLKKPKIAVIASAFPWVGLPNDAVEMINAAIGVGVRTNFAWVDCNKRPRLPNWTIEFGPDGQTITLTPWDYLIETYDKVFEQLKCVSAFYSLSEYGEKEFVILGSVFLNGLYSVFDADRKSISFASRPL
ncbi:aspartic peptidase domain-containing protein [Phaeosphaeriaceae sp. PMI808]|nr:aspartic peptidase domain-containing protein [Phaeosphaeriaceae sp. PMI808]